MDIHRCRFVPFPPSTINALAFSHSHISKDQKTAPPRLAIGRANGDIEIWNPLRGSWLQETIIHGGKDRSIDGLVWTQNPNEEVNGKTIIGKSRLFSVGYTTTVTEWDLRTGRPLRHASGNHGEIWCIAAQPALAPVNPEANGISSTQWEGQNLIAGCTDGALVLYSTKDEDLQLQRVLVRPSAKRAKIISITFQDRNIVVAGCTDSIIRIYDIRNGGTLLRSMTTGSGPKGGPKEIIIWSVKVLKDGTIVSGDSTGELKIWDGKTYTLRQRIKSHEQDVLSLAASANGSTIFSGGMDRRTVTYKPEGKGKPRWAEVSHRRFHNHDVKAMTSFEGGGMSVAVSGGPDASPIVTPLSQFAFENQRSLPFLPQELTVGSSPRKRLLLSWWDREVHVWRVNKTTVPSSDEDGEERTAAKGRKLVAKILIKGEANITSATLSSEGNLLAVSTTAEIKVFQLRPRNTEESDSLGVSRLILPEALATGARLIQFSPDGKWLSIIRPDSHILLARISTDPSASSPLTFHPTLSKLSRLDRKTDKFALLGGLGTYDRTITQIAWSSGSKVMAVSDLSGYIDSFVLSGVEDTTLPPPTESDAASSSSDSDSESESDSDEDSKSKSTLIFGQHWTRNPSTSLLPKLPAAPVVLSFRPSTSSSQKPLTNGVAPHPTRNNPHPVSHDLPSGESRLLVVTATSEIFEFDVLKGGLSPWSRRNPPQSFPATYRKTLDQAKGVIWDVGEEKERVWVWGVGWLWMFDLSRDFVKGEEGVKDEDDEDEGEQVGGSRKRRRLRHGKENPSGAGGLIPDDTLSTGISRKIRKLTQGDDDTKIDEESMDLVPAFDEEEESKDGEESPNHWHTFKYRPILGVVVVGEGEEGEFGPEVAVIERPIWEASLPPRFYGEQEWRDKNSVD